MRFKIKMISAVQNWEESGYVALSAKHVDKMCMTSQDCRYALTKVVLQAHVPPVESLIYL